MNGEVNTMAVPQASDGLVRLGGLEVDFSRKEVRSGDGQCRELSEREAQLLHYFSQNPGRVVSRDEILSAVWRLHSQRILTRVIDMHIANLRSKLGRDWLRTVYGRGYVFVSSTD